MPVGSGVIASLFGVGGGGWKGRGGCWWIVGTLLGPERTGDVVSSDIVERVSFSGPFLFPYHSFLRVVLAGGCGGLAGRVRWSSVVV